MKELSKTLIENGIVDKTVAKMFERWGTLSPEEVAVAMQPKAVVTQTLEIILEEIDLLTQPEAIDKNEVRLDPPVVLGEQPFPVEE